MKKAIFHDIESKIYKDIVKSKESIEIAVAWFTNQRLFKLLCKKLTGENGLNISVIMINDPVNLKEGGINWQEYIDLGGKLFLGSDDNLMHHKFCVIDGTIFYNGSYNWTYGAEKSNIENVIRIEAEKELILAFQIHLNQLKDRYSKVKDVKYYSLSEVERLCSRDENFASELKYEWEENIKEKDIELEKIENLLLKLEVLSTESIASFKQKSINSICKNCGDRKEYPNQPLCLKCFRSCRKCGNSKEFDHHQLCLKCYRSCPRCGGQKEYQDKQLCLKCYKNGNY